MKRCVLFGTVVVALSLSMSALSQTKDADGYVINDPEVAKLFKGKAVLRTTDIKLFASLLGFFNDFKMAGAVVIKTDEALDVLLVAQKKYGGIVSANLRYTRLGKVYYDEKSKSYAAELDNGSFLLFNSIHAELIGKVDADLKAATDSSLNARAAPLLKAIADEKKAAAATAEMAQNEKFFQSPEFKAAKKDPATEKLFLKILKDENSLAGVPANERAEYQKALLISTDWTVVKNDLGQPVKMTYGSWVIGKYVQGGRCFFQRVDIKKDYQGGGKYGNAKFDEGQKPSIISCDLIK